MLHGEVVLRGGVANAGAVVRTGGYVLRPSNPRTEAVHRLLRHARSTGFDGVPDPVGIDPDGRERLGFIEGQVAVPPYPDWVQSDEALASITVLLARFHAAVDGYSGGPQDRWSDELADPAGGTLICHNDVCVENVVFRDGVAVALLDFDFAAAGRPVYDLAQFARMCVPVDDDINAARLGWGPADRPGRLRIVADAYGLQAAARKSLVAMLDTSIVRGGEFVRRRVEAGEEGFVRMWTEMGGLERYNRRLRWWIENRAQFLVALS
jgi:Phosphotransferase enzyme family